MFYLNGENINETKIYLFIYCEWQQDFFLKKPNNLKVFML